MTLNDALAALNGIPYPYCNNNCVQDAGKRLAELLNLALRHGAPSDDAPDYVVEQVKNLQSWIDHTIQRDAERPAPALRLVCLT